MELAGDLASLLTLERVDRDLFRGRNANYGPRQNLYGGQVAAQCLLAAAATVEGDRLPHSFHGYFLRAGRTDVPLGTGLVRIPVMAGRTDAPLRICASRCGQTTAAIATSAMASPRRTLEMLGRIVL